MRRCHPAASPPVIVAPGAASGRTETSTPMYRRKQPAAANARGRNGTSRTRARATAASGSRAVPRTSQPRRQPEGEDARAVAEPETRATLRPADFGHTPSPSLIERAVFAILKLARLPRPGYARPSSPIPSPPRAGRGDMLNRFGLAGYGSSPVGRESLSRGHGRPPFDARHRRRRRADMAAAFAGQPDRIAAIARCRPALEQDRVTWHRPVNLALDLNILSLIGSDRSDLSRSGSSAGYGPFFRSLRGCPRGAWRAELRGRPCGIADGSGQSQPLLRPRPTIRSGTNPSSAWKSMIPACVIAPNSIRHDVQAQRQQFSLQLADLDAAVADRHIVLGYRPALRRGPQFPSACHLRWSRPPLRNGSRPRKC